MIAGETQICWVDPNAGLMYRGYDIHEMAEKASFEEVAYLLLNGELPDGEAAWRISRSQIAARARAAGPVIVKCCGFCRRRRIRWTCCAPACRCWRRSIKELNDHSHDANIRKSIRLIAQRLDA